MKKYLACTITHKNGTIFSNPLKLSEVNLLAQMAKEFKSITIELRECSKGQYKSIFG